MTEKNGGETQGLGTFGKIENHTRWVSVWCGTHSTRIMRTPRQQKILLMEAAKDALTCRLIIGPYVHTYEKSALLYFNHGIGSGGDKSPRSQSELWTVDCGDTFFLIFLKLFDLSLLHCT